VDEIFRGAAVRRARVVIRWRRKLQPDRQQPALCVIEMLLDHRLLPLLQHRQLQRIGEFADRRYRVRRAGSGALVQCHSAVAGRWLGVPDEQQAAAREEPVGQPLVDDNAQQCRDAVGTEAPAVAQLATEAVRGHSKRGRDLDQPVPVLDNEYAAEQVAKPFGPPELFRRHLLIRA